MREVKVNWPRLHVTGLDLSPHYLDAARRTLAPWSRTRFVEGVAEAMPFADGEFDIVTCIYLFHELPPRVRAAVAREIARVLRPGGTLILVDSLQTGDEPDYDAMLDSFPILFHEPYYASYLRGESRPAVRRRLYPGGTVSSLSFKSVELAAPARGRAHHRVRCLNDGCDRQFFASFWCHR